MGIFSKMVIFQFFDYWRGVFGGGACAVLYKKKLIYANLFFTMIGE